MLRVFKVTSPMSVGSWILLVSRRRVERPPRLLERLGRLRRLECRSRGRSSFARGAPLATYTGALLANTAIPVWREARDELPWLFGASAAASAGAAASLCSRRNRRGGAGTPGRRRRLARRARAHGS